MLERLGARIRELLEIDDLHDELRDLQERQDLVVEELLAVRNELEDLEVDEIEERLEAIESELGARSGEDVLGADLTRAERLVFGQLVQSDEMLSVSDLAEQLQKKEGTIRKHISNLRDKIALETRKDGRRNLYGLPSETKDEVRRKVTAGQKL